VRKRLVVPVLGLVAIVDAVLGAVLVASPPPAGVLALPALNASLNGISALFLGLGFAFITQGKVRAHLTSMITAFVVSTLFLVSYVVYHVEAGSRAFTGHGWIRAVYFALLASHVVLAAVIVPLALVTLARAWRGRFERHRRLARWTLPVWLYVSVTGVLVYLMLYHGPR
jgi:putative membrane protein